MHLFKLVGLLDMYPEVELLGPVIILVLDLRNLDVVFHSAAPVYIPTNSVQGFPFLYILSNVCYLLTF